jgi:bacterial/archaeal transporter family protein
MAPQATRTERGIETNSSRGCRTEEASADDEENGEIVMTSSYVWFHWALLSAVFASLTAIFAKIGLEGVDSDFATLIRTFIILFAIIGFVYYTGKWSDPFALRPKTWTFLTLSGLATGASWLCYFRALKIGDAAKVAPVDKLSVVLVAIFAVIFLGERPLAKDWIGILLVAGGVVLLGWKR